MKGFKRAMTISVVVEMKQNTGIERQNIFVYLFLNLVLFVSASFLMAVWEEGR